MIVDRSKTKAIIVRNNQALYVAEASSKLEENDEKQEDGSEVISNIVVQDEIDEMNERATV